MYSTSYDNTRLFIRKYVLRHSRLSAQGDLSALIIGDADRDADLPPLFDAINCACTPLDVAAAGTGLELGDAAFDIVVASQSFVRHPNHSKLFGEVNRVVRDDGLVVMTVPAIGTPRVHEGVVYGFDSEMLEALAIEHGTTLIDVWADRRGIQGVVVGVFSRENRVDAAAPLPSDDVLGARVQNRFPAELVPEHEIRNGVEPSFGFLARVHHHLMPRSYLEVGVFTGFSLGLSSCPSIGIDPYPELDVTLNSQTVVKEMTSDDFFMFEEIPAEMTPLDLSYIDGLHLIENVLKDFMNIERHASASSAILIDDVFPNHRVQGARTRVSQNWTGDVWKIAQILRTYRPDLLLIPVDTEPTGTLVVLGADPSNDELWNRYDEILDWAIITLDEPPDSVIERSGAFDPTDPLLGRVFEMVRDARSDPRLEIASRCRQLVADALPRVVAAAR